MLLSYRAQRHPSVGELLRRVCRSAARECSGRLWLAVPDAGRPDGEYAGWINALVEETGTTILAPDGPVAFVPGGSLFAGTTTGAWGWRAFQPDHTTPVVGERYPRPDWQDALPRTVVSVDRLLAEPVPAGVLLRDAGLPPVRIDDAAFRLPMDVDMPAVVVDSTGSPPPAPHQVADLLQGLDRQPRVRLVAGAGTTRLPDIAWIQALAAELRSRMAATVRMDTWDPQKGCTPARAPAAFTVGWQRLGTRSYRTGADNAAVAEVLPAGILLRPEGLFSSDATALFDPLLNTIIIGTRGLRVSDRLVEAVSQVLLTAPADDRAGLRIELSGVIDDKMSRRLSHVARDICLTPPEASKRAAVPARENGNVRTRLLDDEVTHTRVVDPSAIPDAMVVTRPTFAAPVMVVSNPSIADNSTSSLSTPAGAHATPGQGPAEAHSSAIATSAVENRPSDDSERTATTARSEGPVQENVPLSTTPAVRITNRPSTEDDRHRFAAALGGRFTNYLAGVNTALSRWPALRQADTAKADHVAVCVFLGGGEDGATDLNLVLSSGRSPRLDGYLPCLVSGLLRLPLHRRPVIWQERWPAPADAPYRVGAILTEAVFRSAAASGEPQVPDANIDVLVLPRTARQVSVFASEGELDEVVFLPGTQFRVLAVHRPDERGIAAVLLRELAAGEELSATELGETDVKALERLQQR
ncbi:hypothetical protein, partial [Micromonospora chokoriensis]